MAVLTQLTKETASINLSFYSSGMTEDFIQSARREEPHKEIMEGYAVADIAQDCFNFSLNTTRRVRSGLSARGTR
ncbi:hypothetical protein NBG4_500011 [Candidatus Sulfobium mesophilum]|uniref:Uncharacterized protein n=1 Tax=Candidatus Sulfobium mesophilum TaxID=2016548 RepID=A0A2U3QIV5_9BACT|nr:hypothetical protein NBG4_500011 [Candidatus Sulfobium mesophilum]